LRLLHRFDHRAEAFFFGLECNLNGQDGGRGRLGRPVISIVSLWGPTTTAFGAWSAAISRFGGLRWARTTVSITIAVAAAVGTAAFVSRFALHTRVIGVRLAR
jgi:hypothetical protein